MNCEAFLDSKASSPLRVLASILTSLLKPFESTHFFFFLGRKRTWSRTENSDVFCHYLML